MPVIRTQDRAREFRVTIEGRLAGESVQQVASLWAAALAQPMPPQVTVEISYLTGYDSAGAKLLREMHNHGTTLVASTPDSLVFLDEISTSRRRRLTVVNEPIPMPVNSSREPTVQPIRRRAASAN